MAHFIARIERTDHAFQRQLSRAKVRAIENFYENAGSQPPIPGTILLFTPERLRFDPVGRFESVGDLEEPREKLVVFDARGEDFAAEMFVVINSTPTRINKSHLVDLYERVSWASPTGSWRRGWPT